MASLKDLKNRIDSVKSTQKITKAMQMVAAAKLKRAQNAAEAARPYAERMEGVLAGLASAYKGREDAPALLGGTGKSDTHLLVVATGERGNQPFPDAVADRLFLGDIAQNIGVL